MHISALPLTLLALIPLYLCADVQRPLAAHPNPNLTRAAAAGAQPDSSTWSITLVDALSADPDKDYTSLLRLLQRARLIPTLNRLNGSTFFAPSNDAIARHAAVSAVWADANVDTQDNINEQLRQELLYHLLNFTLTMPGEGEVQVTETLHYPRKNVDPPTQQPPPGPPWMPVPGGTLGGAPQRLRVSGRVDGEKTQAWAAVDWKGDGGTKVLKYIEADNGHVLGVGEVLDVPGDLGSIVSIHPKLSYLRSLLPQDILDKLRDTPQLTLFLPTDDAWTSLAEIDRVYLESEFATDDVRDILSMHTLKSSDVKWSDKLKDGTNVDSMYGSPLTVNLQDGVPAVNGHPLAEADIYASNGVLHLVDSLLIPPGALEPTPEKYLLALNCSVFIGLLHSANLTSLVNGSTTEPRTILTLPDDVLTPLLVGGHEPEFPKKDSEDLAKAMAYHFLPDLWTPTKLKDGMLLATELVEAGLNGSRQVLSVELNADNNMDEKEIVKGLRFGGSAVLKEPIQINNTIIYQLSNPVTPPPDVLALTLPSLTYSTFISAVFSADLDYRLKTAPCTTVLIPPNAAFEQLGELISSYLLLQSSGSKADLESVLMHHVIQGVYYTDALRKEKSFKTLEGSDLRLSTNGKNKDGDKMALQPSGGWDGVTASLVGGHRLSKTGAVYEVDGILIPRSVELTNAKLFKAAQGTTMAGLISKAGMGWVLNGTAPPTDSDWAQEDVKGLGWTLLCPVDDAFKGMNLTELKADEARLKAFVYQHIIPIPRDPDSFAPGSGSKTKLLQEGNAPLPLPLEKTMEYDSLQSRSSLYADLEFISPNPSNGGSYEVRIKDYPKSKSSSDNSTARIISWGRCTTNGGIGGVFQIDQMLMPWHPSVWEQYGPPVAGCVVGVFVIGVFFALVRLVWKRDVSEATYEPVNGYEEEEGDGEQPPP